jgi:hypothetical protein
MKFFKKSTSTEHLFITAHHNTQVNTLTHVMHLFEEKNKYSPAIVSGPLPIKANGAIVVNRPSQRKSQMGTIRSLPLYLQDEPEDEIVIQEEEKDISDMRVTLTATTDESSSISSSNDNMEEVDMMYLIHEENKRLRQQILLEREQSERWRLGQEKLKEELMLSKQRIKTLEKNVHRFQNMILPSPSIIHQNKRRLSTGMNIISNQDIITSYERKLQILLNEINAMESQENDWIQHSILQKNESEKLHRKLNYKDDIIRQLAYDLQFEKRKEIFIG